MKISNKCDYACRALLDMSINGSADKVVSVADISERQQIPPKYLEQILVILRNSEIVTSKRGKGGGYLLARSPREITLKEIVLTIDGDQRPFHCYGDNKTHCHNHARCPIQQVWQEVERQQMTMLETINFEELSRKKLSMEKQEIMYYI